MNFLNAYILHPKIVCNFTEKNEKIILMVRAHPLTQIYWVVNGILFFAILAGFDFVFLPYLNLLQKIFINLFVTIVIFSYWWFNFLSWFFNVGIITNQRIIDVDFHSLVYKEITSAKLEKVEDITVKSGGFLASIFNFGNIFVQTAGTEVNIEFINIPFPDKVRDLINNLSPTKK